MATTAMTYDQRTTGSDRQRLIRRVLTGAATFDATMGAVCLAAAGPIADWLSISEGSVRITAVVFLIAAVAGVQTVLRSRLDMRWIVAANVVFAAWCIAVIGFDAPGAVGLAMLAASAAAAAGTAVTEHWLGTA